MNAVGGYFELELAKNNQLYYSTFYAVNSCRNALLLLAKTKNYKKVYIPYYTCNVLEDVLINNKIEVEFYQIDQNLEVVNFPENNKNEAILYTNYFGIKDYYIKKISTKYNHLIIDNAQAFFSAPINDLDTIYSPRKFFGVPDGGLLYTKTMLYIENYPQDFSYDRCSHLLKRIEISPENGYDDFLKNDAILDKLTIMKMSKLTQSLLSQISYDKVKETRKSNFSFLHEKLRDLNELKIDVSNNLIPLVYPLLLKDGVVLKKKLIKNRIFVATYWPDVLNKVPNNSFENYLVNNLLALPIDQRYNKKEMDLILKHLI